MSEILEKINSPKDLRKLDMNSLIKLCDEIRYDLIHTVSHTGGHLASGLGVVELTVAIHSVFDTPKDTLIFDVGHQCYAHKLLTGRRESFEKLRKKDGISGFPKPCESEYDSFICGHASTSISLSVGLSMAKE
ncbi:MAG: 1-deoxy-D-xylulose-5-phosphate synthase N-terminal domain-containing protein, partial [Oscillospiraceae bacterium]